MESTAATVSIGEFRFRGYHGCHSVCRLQVFDRGADYPYTVLVTELDSNAGTSVTNAAEIIAEAVWRLLERPTRNICYIEHYEDRMFIGTRPLFREEFDLVQFDRGESRDDCIFRRPHWRRISKQEAETLCGCYL